MTVSREDLEAHLSRLRATTRDPRAGVFGPGSKMWEVSREAVVFLAGGRAALLQTAHAYVAHGVDQHSRTKTDPYGRFFRTFDNVFSMIFGDLSHAERSARRVHTIHQRIHGVIDEDVGGFKRGDRYHANHEPALLWVYATLLDSAVLSFELVIRPMGTREKDAYYQEAKRFGYLFGIPDDVMPGDWPAFRAYVDGVMDSELLGVGRPAAELRRFLFRAPMAPLAIPMSAYTAVTGQLLPPRLRAQYGFPDGAAARATLDLTLASLRRTVPRLPASVRYLPAYNQAIERVGDARQSPVGRALGGAFDRLVRSSHRRARGQSRSSSGLA
ncbi:MAG: DUF2236 domain-containing protein [Polyangiaceae bacterium]|nr:DUF2236 domain-containing protein [Polyangiaceae bacterium]